MAVDVQLMGERAAVERLIAALSEPLELALKARVYPMRGERVPDGVRRFGEVRPRASAPGTAVAVRQALLELPTGEAEEPRVRLRLTGEETDVLAVLVAARHLLHLAFPPRDFPQDGGFGVDLYLHIYTGHLPEPASTTSPSTAVTRSETPRRGRKWAASERADRPRLQGRRALPGRKER
jgi:hypothetical protein